MFQADMLIEQIRSTDHGIPRMECMKNAIAEADAAAEHYWRIYFRYEYIKESIFHEDNFKGIIMFPELLQIFDEHPELEDDTYEEVMHAFKWILENAADYYQISLDEIERYFEEYEKRCKKYGFTMRVYHMKKSRVYLPIDLQTAKAEYQAFHSTRRDGSSDCEACEIHYDMSMSLDFGNEEEALRIAAPILDGRKRCQEIPHCTYGKLTEFYLYRGELSEALYYGKLCERYTNNEPEFLMESGILLELYSASDVRTGWKLFKRNVQNFVQCKNPKMRMCFARGAYRLLRCVEKETEFSESIFLKPLPIKPTKDGYSISELISFFYDTAKEQSMLLDKRNGTEYYMKLLETALRTAETDGTPLESVSRPAHGLITKMPGILAAVPAPSHLPDMAEISKNLEQLSDTLELISNTAEEEVCTVNFRFEEYYYEAHLFWVELNGEFSGRPCYDIDEETYNALLSAPKQLMLQMEYSDDPKLSYHLAMRLLTAALPDMLGVIDTLTRKVYAANWIKFAASCRNAVSLQDLLSLSITGNEESDEVWITTTGLCTAGMRELEVVGAVRDNFSYYANILFNTACAVLENTILPDAGAYVYAVRVNGEECPLTWETPESILDGNEELFAAKAERSIPSGILCAVNDEGGSTPLTDHPPLAQGGEVEYGNLHSEFIRRIYLAKETLPHFRRAYERLTLSLPIRTAAVRAEFTVSPEMREKCGYAKELLWADISRIDGSTIKAKLGETSEVLPEYKEGDEIIITEENITGWLIRLEGSEEPFTEEDSYLFMQKGVGDEG